MTALGVFSFFNNFIIFIIGASSLSVHHIYRAARDELFEYISGFKRKSKNEPTTIECALKSFQSDVAHHNFEVIPVFISEIWTHLIHLSPNFIASKEYLIVSRRSIFFSKKLGFQVKSGSFCSC